MILVDSSVWIDYFRGMHSAETEFLDSNVDRLQVGLTDLILCEVLQGARNDGNAKNIMSVLSKTSILPGVDNNLAVIAASNYRKLRSLGFTTRTSVDVLLATLCIESDYELLHRDRDFDPFEKHLGLRVIYPRQTTAKH